MNTEQANEKIADLKSRFTWRQDFWLDNWHVMPKEGPVSGDCDDFAYRALLDVAGGWLKAWYWLLTFQACFFLVTSPRGGSHMVLWIKGYGWTDNFKSAFTETYAPHSRPWWFPVPFPFLWPGVLLKLAIGLILFKVFRVSQTTTHKS